MTESSRLGPSYANGIKKVQVGCGPHNILPDWWNIDIRAFPGIDMVMDVTQPWPFNDLEYIYGEHFLEHLSLEGAVAFLDRAWHSLKPGGILRLSTPSLEWVLLTHFILTESNEEKRIASTFAINRAFHGWGHQFLYSKEFLTSLLEKVGWQKVKYCEYGKSEHLVLTNIERHGRVSFAHGYPSVWIVEALRGDTRNQSDLVAYTNFIEESYIKYVKAGH
jgi:predicted SAM-dependent methyltransferase